MPIISDGFAMRAALILIPAGGETAMVRSCSVTFSTIPKGAYVRFDRGTLTNALQDRGNIHSPGSTTNGYRKGARTIRHSPYDGAQRAHDAHIVST